jgi:hypothetical protein
MPGVGGLTLAQAATLSHPGYVAGRWYCPFPSATPGTTNPYSATQVRLSPFILSQQVTISDLGVLITTLAAAGNIRLAIYASDPVTKQPTGSPLAVTGDISTAAAGGIGGDITGADVVLPAGLYWFATAADNATVVLGGTAATHMQTLFGATSAATAISAATTYRLQYTINSTTYGTWPVASAGNLAEAASLNAAIGAFKVSGVG